MPGHVCADRKLLRDLMAECATQISE
jgi:hypothetical protein